MGLITANRTCCGSQSRGPVVQPSMPDVCWREGFQSRLSLWCGRDIGWDWPGVNQKFLDENVLKYFAFEHFPDLLGGMAAAQIQALGNNVAGYGMSVLDGNPDDEERILSAQAGDTQVGPEWICPDLGFWEEKAVTFLLRSEITRHPDFFTFHILL